MEYKGIYKLFDAGKINTYPLNQRTNKVKLEDLILPDSDLAVHQPDAAAIRGIEKIAAEIVSAHRQHKPVVVFSGAHLVKNGLGPLMVDLLNRNIITLFAGNGATAIHDFELALIGETSEYVPEALEKGQFGMAYEFAYINTALKIGNAKRLGYGESLGRMIADSDFCDLVLKDAAVPGSPGKFLYPQTSILYAGYKNHIPCTIHAGIGTDVIDQHPSFDGEAKGGCSGRDFLIFTEEIKKLAAGGVVLNIGSAVTGPEVLLKAISMVSNTGFVPHGIITADFDLRSHHPEEMKDESKERYYYRDQKSIVTRIPAAFNGTGYYIRGNQMDTIPLLYARIIENLNLKQE
jgi:hypothetical protein